MAFLIQVYVLYPISHNWQMLTTYILLINELKKPYARISKCELSWSGHLASFKMMLLQKILYLFRTLPISVKKVHLLAFVWKNMEPLGSHTQLLKHKHAGGVGMVDFHDYLLVTQLSQLQYWFSLYLSSPMHCCQHGGPSIH